MVHKEILIQYCDLQNEIKELERSKSEVEKKFKEFLDGETVTDIVTGGLGGKEHFKIEGYPVVNQERVRNALMKKIQHIEERYTDLLELTNEVEEYIESIDDCRIRRIITMRFIHKLSWQQVANRIGKYTTADSVRMEYNRFIEKN